MATAEHKELSTYIKKIHSSLRIKSKEVGFDLAWKEHCSEATNLQKYADSMRKLATEHWDENAKKNCKVISRVEWTYNFCTQYFFHGGLLKHRNKEQEVLAKIADVCEVSYIADYIKLRLIDTGSCYNPFSKYNCFDIVALDIAPACEDVFQCDFLNLIFGEKDIFQNKTVIQLQSNSYHIVVFSLLIEYLPCPKQRMLCCENAYNLLEPESILIIITPDSKHVGANAKYMKSWRYTLSLLGFSRICYEKLPYLHCMVFRKSIHSAIPKRWAKMHENDNLFHVLHIPQDFKENEYENCSLKEEIEEPVNLLPELPFANFKAI